MPRALVDPLDLPPSHPMTMDGSLMAIACVLIRRLAHQLSSLLMVDRVGPPIHVRPIWYLGCHRLKRTWATWGIGQRMVGLADPHQVGLDPLCHVHLPSFF